MLFSYKAIDTDGNKKTGKIDAPSRDNAINALQRRDLVITSLEAAEEEGGGSLSLSQEITWFEHITNKDVLTLTQQLSTLFGAQVSALRIFQLIAAEAEKTTMRNVLNQIADDLQAGSTISDAFEKHPNVFSPFYVNMVRSGEESGRLDQIFAHLAKHLERMDELNSRARNALVYPTFVVVVFVAVMSLLFIVVIPQISKVLEGTGQELPIYTKAVLGVSSFFASYWVFILAALVIGGVIGWKYIQTNEGRRKFDRAKYNVPVLGSLFRNMALARISDNMNTMLVSGIPMVRGLEITRDIVGDSIYKDILDESIDDVKGGQSLSSSFAQYEEMPGILVQMIKVGEESGELGSLLETLARFYKREVENTIDNLVSLIEPTLIIILGLGVGVLLAAVLMPIYNLAGGF